MTPQQKYRASERYKETRRLWQATNRTALNKQNAEWRKKHPEKTTASHRDWVNKNKDKAREIARRHYYNNPRAIRAGTLKRRGLTEEDYQKLLHSQDGKCSICGAPHFEEKWKRLAIDHDHITNKNRGLLCNNCNHMLGCARDCPEILAAGISYLASWKEF